MANLPKDRIQSSGGAAMPSVRSSRSFADGLAAALDEVNLPGTADPLTVWAEWDDAEPAEPGPFMLSVRSGGAELARASADASHRPLSIRLESPGSEQDDLVVELSWPRGSRHLHVLRPLRPCDVRFDRLVSVAPSAADIAAEGLAPGIAAAALTMPPSYWWRSMSTAEPQVEALCAPTRALRTSEVERGFGVEVELVTVASPGRPGVLALVNPGAGAAINEVLQRCVGGSPAANAALRRCKHWEVGDDVCIRSADSRCVRRTLAACEISEADAERARALLLAAPRRTHRTEFRSAAPPRELSFDDGGADEVRCFLGLVRLTGAAATSVHRTHTALLSDPSAACDSGTAVHIHVNVRNADARGEPLSARALLRIVLAWVRFDAVTARFARAWMWREPSCAPLFATGPEFARRAGVAVGGDEDGGGSGGGSDSDGDSDSEGGEGGCGAGAGGSGGDAERPAAEWDVPAFFTRAHALVASAAFCAMDEAAQVDALFGEGSPAAGLGRYCSLNVQSVRKYGTLEMRRFHGTLDGDLIAHWAHLCVAFVEGFRHARPAADGGGYSEERLLTMPIDEALAALQAAQERASAAELMRLLGELVDPATAEALSADAAGPDPRTPS